MGETLTVLQGSATVTRKVVAVALVACAGPDREHSKIACGDCGTLLTSCSCKDDRKPTRYIPGPCAGCARVEVGTAF